MLKNRIFAPLTAVLMVAVLLTSCAAPAAAPTAAPAPANTQAPAPTAAPQATTAPAATASNVFMTINVEQQSTWVRNFNPFSPDARLQAGQGTIYEPMMIFNKATGELVPWLATGYK